MAKTVDVPKALRQFNSEFNKLNYRYDTADVFCDLIDLMIAMFKFEGDKELGDRLKAKYQKDYEQLCICVREMFIAYDQGLEESDWYDGLGEYYEVITSSYKSSRLGQFFTPKPICDLMASINFTDTQVDTIDEKVVGKVVGDPACGSGRMLLAFNNLAPGNFHYATDIDSICVKMTAINMCIHGICGQVVCADALWYRDSWRFGYQINETLKLGLPSIRNIEQSACFQSRVSDVSFEETKVKKVEEQAREEEVKREEKIQKVVDKALQKGQYSLF